MSRKVLFLLLGLALSCLTAYAAEQKFPFVAEVNEENINIRAGGNVNFEKLGLAQKGQLVTVLAKEFTWYKIALPDSAKCFVSKDYVKMLDAKTGVITGSRVNLRAGPNTNASPLGQLVKDDMVEVLKEVEGWYQIKPTSNTAGWIAEQFLVFKNNQAPEQKPVMKITDLVKAEAPKPIKEKVEPSPPVTPVVSEAQGRTFIKTGKLEPLEMLVVNQDIQYKLVVSEDELYLLEIPQSIGRFSDYMIKVSGTLRKTPLKESSIPVLVPSKVELVL